MGLKTFVFQEAPSNRLRLGGEFHNVEFQLLEEDECLGSLFPPLEVLFFKIDEVKRSFYRQFLEEMVKHMRAIEHSRPQANETIRETIRDTLGFCLIGAVLMDMTDEVDSLVQLYPGVEHTAIKIEWMGKDFYKFIVNVKNHNRGLKKEGDVNDSDCVNAVGVALRLSREACLNVFLKHNPKALEKLGSFDGKAWWTLNNFQDYFPYACSPSLMARAQAINMDTVPKKSFKEGENWYNLDAHCGPYKIAQSSKGGIGSCLKDPYFTAMVRLGVFDKRPEEALPTAVGYGHMELMQRLVPLVKDWDAMRELFAPVRSPIKSAARWGDYQTLLAPEGHAQIEKVVVAFINECLQRGQRFILLNDPVKDPYGNQSITTIEPFWSIAKWNCHAIMLKLIDEGGVNLNEMMRPLDADKELPLMEALDLYAPESAAVIHSHASREKAHALIDEIDEENTN